MSDIVTDFTQFAALRRDAERGGNDETLRQVAEQFEALFLKTMLSSMRKATPGDPLLGDSQAFDTYREILDQQLASDLAGRSGIGLADVLVRQLGNQSVASGDLRAAGVAEVKPGSEIRDLPDKASEGPLAFVRRLWPYATRAAQALGTVPQAVIAQAALETGWGQRQMQHADGTSANNFFGIKAGGDWQGRTVSHQTLEFVDGLPVRERARFRAYPNAAAGFGDYARFLTGSPRYGDVRGHGDDIAGFARSLSAAGYATDPDYASKLTAIATGERMQSAMAALKFGGLTPMD